MFAALEIPGFSVGTTEMVTYHKRPDKITLLPQEKNVMKRLWEVCSRSSFISHGSLLILRSKFSMDSSFRFLRGGKIIGSIYSYFHFFLICCLQSRE